jgi:dienelactone hydrolase
MRSLRCIALLAAVLPTVLVPPAGAASAGINIGFSSLDANQSFKVSGTLYLPEDASTPCPAIVMVHGNGGIDSVGGFYRESIVAAGIAIFEVDFKTGVYNPPTDRPLQATFLPLVFAALKELRELPSIDPDRIGILGFSMGGGIALRTAVEANRKTWMGGEKGFAAHVAFYPAAGPFISSLESSGSTLTGAPMIVFYGTEDAYGDAKAVPDLKRLLQRKYNFQLVTVEYPGATHGFNRRADPVVYADPAAIGGKGSMTWNPDAANDSLTRVVAFLRQYLAAK